MNVVKQIIRNLLVLLILPLFCKTAFSFNVTEKKLLALKGDRNTQYQLGLYYQKGKDKDLIEAYYWIKKAGQQDHRMACHYLGRAHLFGKGTSCSIDLAKKWFLISANQGDSNSMLDLGLCFELEKEWISSAAWYKTAQQYGSSRASKNLKVVSKYIPKSQSGNLNLMVNKIHSSISKEKKSEIVFKPNFENPIKKIGLENGFIYWGEIKNGIPHGYGKKKLGKSTTYQGEFVMGLEHGYGTSFGKDGKISFQGQWKEGLPSLPQKEFVRDFTND
jgi:TPR repeat protein